MAHDRATGVARPQLGLAIVGLGASLAPLDIAVNVALPAITAPADNTTIAAHTDLTITANASDDKGDPKVSFYANDHFLGSLTAPPYSLVWSNVPAGNR